MVLMGKAYPTNGVLDNHALDCTEVYGVHRWLTGSMMESAENRVGAGRMRTIIVSEYKGKPES